uniref:Uncharacterized protein n=1 Tax=Pyramimonas obovata TaxID=1411642 RepID=A0A7S0MVQ4_9CHLO|mmetsp:Transcript_13168/g.27914  ORF Transcript_13168/g.27914 Transcript_13168/m.27914 type:complete len:462 (+) Transcript_13168:335-1720(+)
MSSNSRAVHNLRERRAAERAVRAHIRSRQAAHQQALSAQTGPTALPPAPPPLSSDEDVMTFLCAARLGDCQTLAAQLDAGQRCDVRRPNLFSGMGALHVAAMVGSMNSVQLLLRWGADVNLGTLSVTRQSPVATWRADGALYGAVDVAGTPLDMAVRCAHTSIIKVLIAAGAMGATHMASWVPQSDLHEVTDPGEQLREIYNPAGSVGNVWPDRVRLASEAHHRLRLVLHGGDDEGWSKSSHLAHPPAFVAAVQTVLFAAHRPPLVNSARPPAACAEHERLAEHVDASSEQGPLTDNGPLTRKGDDGGCCGGFWSLGTDELEHIFRLAAFPLSDWCRQTVCPQSKRCLGQSGDGRRNNIACRAISCCNNNAAILSKRYPSPSQAQNKENNVGKSAACNRVSDAVAPGRSATGSMTVRPSAQRVDAPAAEVAQEMRLLGFGPHWGAVLAEMRDQEKDLKWTS